MVSGRKVCAGDTKFWCIRNSEYVHIRWMRKSDHGGECKRGKLFADYSFASERKVFLVGGGVEQRSGGGGGRLCYEEGT